MKSVECKGLSGAFLKNLALILMFINHFCAAYFDTFIGSWEWMNNFHWYLTRPAFVIYAFLISEGMFYTSNRRKYQLRLLITALISEIFYDLAMYQTMFYWNDQNVFFDLLMGTLAIEAYDRNRENPGAIIGWVFLICFIADLAEFNYGFFGVLVILFFYLFREDKKKIAVFMPILILVLSYGLYSDIFMMYGINEYLFAFVSHYALQEAHSILAIPLILLYNGKKGKQLSKWFYYGFYPAHMIFIWLTMRILRGY